MSHADDVHESRLVDSYGRGHRDLRISLTDRCSLRCTYCMPADFADWIPSAELITTDELMSVLEIAVDEGIEEGMQYGMICYSIPHRIFPAGYHCDPKIPLGYLGLASQKHYMSFYLGFVYCGCGDSEPIENNKHAQWFREAWAKTGKQLDMGKSCIRFKQIEDLALDVIAESIRRVPTQAYIEYYMKQRASITPRHRAQIAKAAKPRAARLQPKKRSTAKAKR